MMNRRTIIGVTVLALACAGNAFAALTFTLNKAALMELWEISENPVNNLSELDLVTDNAGAFGAPLTGEVGYLGSLYNASGQLAEMQIGANSTGSTLLPTSGKTTAEIIGLALNSANTTDLSAFDAFDLVLTNDNQSVWSVSLFLTTASGTAQSAWVALNPLGATASLSLDISGIADRNNVLALGFAVRGNLNNTPPDPSNPDAFHISASPVPAPAAAGLVFVGLGLIGWFRRRVA